MVENYISWDTEDFEEIIMKFSDEEKAILKKLYEVLNHPIVPKGDIDWLLINEVEVMLDRKGYRINWMRPSEEWEKIESSYSLSEELRKKLIEWVKNL